MPRRKYGVLEGKSLKDRTKEFLQEFGFTSFDPKPIIAQLPRNDLKIKFPKDYEIPGMKFESVQLPGVGKFEYIHIDCPKYGFFFIMYISEKQLWRAFVPTDGNSFCKKKKKVYGFCGCHDESSKSVKHPGSSEHEIVGRMQPCTIKDESINVKIKNTKVRKGPATDEWVWDDQEESLGDTSVPSSKKQCKMKFERIGMIKDIAWSILEFVSQVDGFKFRRTCKLWDSIIRSEVFQKRRWEKFSKDVRSKETKGGSEGYFGSINDFEFQNMSCVPNHFTLDVDGTFDSLYNSKKVNAENTRRSGYFYDINLCHCIIQFFCSGYDGDDVLPYPMHESKASPAIFDLEQEYTLNEDLKKMEEIIDEKCECYGYDFEGKESERGIDVAIEHRNKEKDFPSYTLAKQVISKMVKAAVEFEYFDHQRPDPVSKVMPQLYILKL